MDKSGILRYMYTFDVMPELVFTEPNYEHSYIRQLLSFGENFFIYFANHVMNDVVEGVTEEEVADMFNKEEIEIENIAYDNNKMACVITMPPDYRDDVHVYAIQYFITFDFKDDVVSDVRIFTVEKSFGSDTCFFCELMPGGCRANFGPADEELEFNVLKVGHLIGGVDLNELMHENDDENDK